MNTKPQNHEDGLIKIYLDQVAALAVKALDGVDVRSEIAAVVQKAAAHFAGIKKTTEVGNLRAFAEQLAMRAEVTHESQPAYRATLEHAKQLVDEVIQKRENPPA